MPWMIGTILQMRQKVNMGLIWVFLKSLFQRSRGNTIFRLLPHFYVPLIFIFFSSSGTNWQVIIFSTLLVLYNCENVDKLVFYVVSQNYSYLTNTCSNEWVIPREMIPIFFPTPSLSLIFCIALLPQRLWQPLGTRPNF